MMEGSRDEYAEKNNVTEITDTATDTTETVCEYM